MRKGLTVGAIAFLAFAAGTAVSFFTLPLWIAVLTAAAKEGPRSDWLGFAGGVFGNMLTAAVAGLTIWFAWAGVKRQMRLSIISREEDRIERGLPGLRQLLFALDQLAGIFPLTDLPPAAIVDVLEGLRYHDRKSSVQEQVRLLMPLADEQDRRTLSEMLRKIVLMSSLLKSIVGDTPVDELEAPRRRRYDGALAILARSTDDVLEFRDEVAARIARHERLQPEIRREIEDFFDA